jgi:thiol:disulfide interchange protein/DsbC/DsbD-like thiol-disulfide interchange protein
MMGMTIRLFLGVLVLQTLPALAGIGEGVVPELVTDATAPLRGGVPFTATVILHLKPGWHTYWEYPGDAGVATKVEWHLPEGWSAGPLQYSLPSLFREPGDLIIYGYERTSYLRATITPPISRHAGSPQELKATVSWLACKELCVPGSAELSVRFAEVKTPAGARDPLVNAPAVGWPNEGEPPFPVKISLKNGRAYVSFSGNAATTYTLFPDPKNPDLFSGEAFGPVTTLSSGSAYSMTLPWNEKAPFQALLVEDNGGTKNAWWIGKKEGTNSKTRAGYNDLMILITALCSGFLGGLILNLMPCVLPVISLKIFSFVHQAGESPRRILLHGVSFAVGIVSWFLGLGILVILLKSGGSQVTWGAFQFQNPYFVVFLSALVFLFALNLFGVFEIVLSFGGGSSMDRLASKGGYLGSYFQGLFATLLATPCTAPFLGSALGFAFAQSAPVILVMFLSVASGMSLPYLILSLNPTWRAFVPKPGIWMERLKQFMGFPLLATLLWLLSVLGHQRGPLAVEWMLVLLLILGFCAWIFGMTGASAFSRWRWPLLTLTALLALLSLWFVAARISSAEAASSTGSGDRTGSDRIDWIPYSPSELERLRADGKPVLLDFTASWCLTCQFNERTAIDTAAVRHLLRDRGITAMKGDWTNSDPAITAALRSFGRVGVPLVVFYPSGKGSAPVILPELLTERLVIGELGK